MFLSKFSTTFMFRVFHEKVYNLFKNGVFEAASLKTKIQKKEKRRLPGPPAPLLGPAAKPTQPHRAHLPVLARARTLPTASRRPPRAPATWSPSTGHRGRCPTAPRLHLPGRRASRFIRTIPTALRPHSLDSNARLRRKPP
jgi:hypothetical protein